MPGSRSVEESERQIASWDDRVVAGMCIVACGASAVAGVFGVSLAWQMPFLFLAIYVIMRALVPLRKSKDELARMRDELRSLRESVDRSAPSRIEHYPNAAAFYGAATAYLLQRGVRNLDTWYVRTGTPDDFSQSTQEFADYFRRVLDWARAGGSVRRLFCSGSSAEFADWTARHRAETRDLTRYEIRDVRWSIRADLLSMAIMDDRAVFLAFTVGARVSGMRLEGPEAAKYFKEYFDRHWENADVVR
ncbi:hypothetical protein GCM10018790_79560 [Kitasatospora xanthocidica]|uniref:hypothetical protein n=1 Tax=Kitasatospora xanthocidica TaxID=83382 RepID=UPI00167AC5AD|nr:hypothetical protein [Kitasatospora xanthocidica]GHF90453.1 hypothetical protein GCM10018790_79560 [Kitasatospora xanthocidica]